MPLLGIAVLGLALVACQTEAQRDALAADSPAEAPAKAETTPDEGPQVIGYGEPTDLTAYLVPGQITLFDFMSEYCGPCRVFAPYLERLHEERDDLTVVKVDINRRGKRGIDWGSPLARQYGVRSVPYFKVFDAKGRLIAEGRDAQPMVISWIEDLPSLQQ
jgi:thiol-disulfide isomerase/thioredoxin